MIIGPTAIGKSKVAIELALQHDFEIISIDSVMIYKYFNIGTSKPTQIEQQGVIHHLIDICEPIDTYSVGQFVSDVNKAMIKIKSQNKRPLLVGGSLMYANALIKSTMNEKAITDPAVRKYYKEKLDSEGLQALWVELVDLDKRYKDRLDSKDTQRILRALEVIKSTGKSLIDHWKDSTSNMEDHFNVIKIIPENRAQMKADIEKRFINMLKEGLIDEVKKIALMDKSEHFKALESIGYKQALKHLNHQYSLIEMQEKAIIATRQFAKRQLTWLRNTAYTHENIVYSSESFKKILFNINKVLDNYTGYQ